MFATRPLGHCATCKGSSRTKNKYITFFNRNYTPNIVLFDNFFKTAFFSEKTVKNCFGGTFDVFLSRGDVLLQKLTKLFYRKLGRYRIFCYLIDFSKKRRIFRENGKKPFPGAVSVKGKGTSGVENEYNLFLWEMRFSIIFHLTVFSKIVTFLEKIRKGNFGALDHFF